MTTRRDLIVIGSTILGIHLIKWIQKYKQQRLTKPVEISKEDLEPDHCDDLVPRRLRKAETVLRNRTSRIVLVLEASCDEFNHQAVFRTAECLGIQHVWVVEPAFYKKHSQVRKISRESTDFLSIRRFQTTRACIEALESGGYEIWATDLNQKAECLHDIEVELPERVAVVIGREADGVTDEMLQASHRRIYYPMFGFADSLNLNVAAALTLQFILLKYPYARGEMLESERTVLRTAWYTKLAKSTEELTQYLAQPPKPYRDVRRPDTIRDSWIAKKVSKKIVKREATLKAQHEINA